MARTDARIGGAHGAGRLYSPPTHYDRGSHGRAYLPTSATPIPHYAERVAMERAYDALLTDRLMVEGCMRVERSGGAYLDPAPSTVGAGEIRVSERVRVRPNRDETGDALLDEDELGRRAQGDYDRLMAPPWLIALVGAGEAMRILASRVERVEGVTVEREPRTRVQATGPDAGASYWTRLAALSADLSLADG